MRRAATRELAAAVVGPPDEPVGNDEAEGGGQARESESATSPVAAHPPVPSFVRRLGAHRAKPDGRRKLSGPRMSSGQRRWFIVVAGATAALTAVSALLVSLNQGSSPHRRADASANTRQQASSAPPQTSVSRPPSPPVRKTAKAASRPRPTRQRSTQPVFVPAAHVSSAPNTQPVVAPARHTSTSAANRPAAPTSFAALAGPGCPGGANAGISIDSTWYAQSSGGWTGDGCSGMFYAKWVHQPGDATPRTFTWRFNTGLTGSATCKVSVYIPDGDSTTVGANPAPYQVYSGPSDSQSAGTFSLDQIHNHGQWLYAGAFPATSGRFSIQVTNIGDGSVEVAADAVQVHCSV